MTIKEAFEKLTAVTAAAMKNPFFVMRKLHDAFADIADKIEGGGGGGSTVEVTQVLSTGTKIATITVDEESTDLYAPTPTPVSHDYSTTERVVGKWIDGTTDVYERTFDFSSSPIVLQHDVWVDSGISASEHIARIISSEVRFNTIILADVEVGVGADNVPLGFQKLTSSTNRSVTDCTLRYLKSTT